MWRPPPTVRVRAGSNERTIARGRIFTLHNCMHALTISLDQKKAPPGYDPTKPWGNPRGTCNQARAARYHHSPCQHSPCPRLTRAACAPPDVGQLHHGSNDETSEENEDDVGRARALLQ